MTNSPIVVLVIEDEQLDFKLLQRALRDRKDIELVWEPTLAKGLSLFDNKTFDVILLDLSLPDSSGLGTIDAFARKASTPIVVMSNTKDEQTALAAVKHGAQDYLFKDQMDTQLLVRTLRYAMERYALLEELHNIRQITRRGNELNRLQTNPTLEQNIPANDASSKGGFKVNSPSVYAAALKTYQELLRHLMGRREYQVKSVNVAEILKNLGTRLGEGGASPHDVIAIHTAGVNAVLSQMPEQKNELCHQEARYLLSGLLGHLCYFYRDKHSDVASGDRTSERAQ